MISPDCTRSETYKEALELTEEVIVARTRAKRARVGTRRDNHHYHPPPPLSSLVSGLVFYSADRVS